MESTSLRIERLQLAKSFVAIAIASVGIATAIICGVCVELVREGIETAALCPDAADAWPRGSLVCDSLAWALPAIGLTMLAMATVLVGCARRHFVAHLRRQQLDRRCAQRALIRSKNRAESASRAKDAYLACMSHELRTPMHGVLGLSRMLLEEPLTREQRAYARNIQSASTALLKLVNGILDLSKIEAGKLELDDCEFDLRDTIDEVRTLMQPLAREKGLALDVDVSMPTSRLRGDALRLQQVLLNLLGNAVKFTERGGVSLAVRMARGADPGSVDVAFSVRDTGVGIHPEAMQKVFSPFVQAGTSTYRTFGGTGLGLSIASRLVGLMGGRLKADSVPGTGSDFSFACSFRTDDRLDDVPVAPECAPFPDSTGGPPARILLVEDCEVGRLYGSAVLEKQGYDVRVAGDGAEAVDLWREHVFDVILMDCHMPGTDGLAATAMIRAEEQARGIERTTIVATTGAVMAGERERCLAAGMDGVIGKPFAVEQLLQCLSDMSRTRAARSSGTPMTHAVPSGAPSMP